MEQASELKWLKWFFSNADFGPAHGDVMQYLFDEFEEATGLQVPKDYREGYEDE